MANVIGIAPETFWRLTPIEWRAITDAHRDHARRVAPRAGAGQGPPKFGRRELARRREFIEDMKRRFPDGPAPGGSAADFVTKRRGVAAPGNQETQHG